MPPRRARACSDAIACRTCSHRCPQSAAGRVWSSCASIYRYAGALPAPSLDTSGATYERVAALPLRIEFCELIPLVRDVSSGFTKVSTVVRLSGDGHEGLGEDITWDQIDQLEHLRHAGALSWLRGVRTFDEFSTLLGLADLFPVQPIRDSSRHYRRWAFESAALDLALRQTGLSLADAVGRSPEAVTFVVSIGTRRAGESAPPARAAPLEPERALQARSHSELGASAPRRARDTGLRRRDRHEGLLSRTRASP